MAAERLAPAKVNLFLHVGPLGADGYHPICTLMTFATVGDVVRMERAAAMSFEVEGPFGEHLAADGDDNLVVRARDAVMEAFEGPWPAFRLTLDKRLPIAAGLGGGSSDAAATLTLMAETFALADGGRLLSDRGIVPTAVSRRGVESLADDALAPENSVAQDTLSRIARDLGADVTACLAAVPTLAQGRGDECDYPPVFPDLDAVLVNPLVPSPTGAVYGAYDAAGAPGGAEPPPWPDPMETAEAFAAFLADCRNDLEAPAISLQPAIAEVLAALRARPQTLIARMSGSGATCFALCADAADRDGLAQVIADTHADWWVQPCRLAGFRP
ncbi:MAG: 4-(cytidine 5'-diphospho)-2-C-methyl-D-erythritol kinase [Caulobacterales bacterium]